MFVHSMPLWVPEIKITHQLPFYLASNLLMIAVFQSCSNLSGHSRRFHQRSRRRGGQLRRNPWFLLRRYVISRPDSINTSSLPCSPHCFQVSFSCLPSWLTNGNGLDSWRWNTTLVYSRTTGEPTGETVLANTGKAQPEQRPHSRTGLQS